jgi:hypothetical protein
MMLFVYFSEGPNSLSLHSYLSFTPFLTPSLHFLLPFPLFLILTNLSSYIVSMRKTDYNYLANVIEYHFITFLCM